MSRFILDRLFCTYNSVRVKLPYATNVSLAKKGNPDKEPEQISAPQSVDFVASVSGLSLNITGIPEHQEVSVYDVRGKKVARQVSVGREMFFILPSQGKYVIRSGNMSKVITSK